MHTKRLDTMGVRLHGLIALTADKDVIDVATVQTVILILDYELTVRTLTDPIDADGTIAQLEGAIRRQLDAHDSLSERDLRRKTGADRKVIWAFNMAITNLVAAKDIFRLPDGKLIRLREDASAKLSEPPRRQLSHSHHWS